MRDRRFFLLTFSFIFLVWFLWSLPLVLGEKIFIFRDVLGIFLPYFDYSAKNISFLSPPPTFFPYWADGVPFRANPNALPFYPSRFLTYFFDFWVAFNLHFIIHWLLSYFGMYKLASCYFDDKESCHIAALSYFLSGFMISMLSFHNLIVIASTVPLVLWGVARGSLLSLVVSSFFLGLASLGGEPLFLAIGLCFVFALPGKLRNHLYRLIIISIPAFIVFLPQLVSFWRFKDFIVRTTMNEPYHYYLFRQEFFSIVPQRWLELFLPHPFGFITTVGPPFSMVLTFKLVPYIYSVYPGLLFLPLFFCGVYLFKHLRKVALFLVIGVFISVILGLNLFVVPILTFGTIRQSAKFWFWCALAIPILIGYMFSSFSEKKLRKLFFWSTIAIFCITMVSHFFLVPEDSILTYGNTIHILRTLPGIILVIFFVICTVYPKKHVVYLLQALTLFSLFYAFIPTADSAIVRRTRIGENKQINRVFSSVSRHFLEQNFDRGKEGDINQDDNIKQNKENLLFTTVVDSASFRLKKKSSFKKVYMREDIVKLAVRARDLFVDVLYGNYHPLVVEASGFMSPFSLFVSFNTAYLDIARRVNVLCVLGVDLYITRLGVDHKLVRLIEKEYDPLVDFFRYKVLCDKSFVYYPSYVVVASDPEDAFRKMIKLDVSGGVVIPDGYEFDLSGGVVEVREWGSDFIELYTSVKERSLLVIRRSFYPVWDVRSSDGKVLDIFPVNIFHIGVIVPEGESVITLSARANAIEVFTSYLSGITLLLLFVSVVVIGVYEKIFI